MHQGAVTQSCVTKLLKPLSDQKEPNSNYVFSPISICSVVGMASFGAKRNTKFQMVSFLGESNGDRIVADVTCEDPSGRVIVKLANRLFVDDGLEKDVSFKHFQHKISSRFSSDVVLASFRDNPEAVRNEINTYVEKSTEGRIKDLMPHGSISTDTRLVLANALYFKASWEHRFVKSQGLLKFSTLDSSGTIVPKNVNQMTLDCADSCPRYIYETNTFSHVLQIPYANPEFSLVIFMPEDPTHLHVVEKQIYTDKHLVRSILKRLRDESKGSAINLSVPTFKMDADSNKYDVKKAMIEAGVLDMFNSKTADFGGIFPVKKERLYASVFVHKAMVIVDENGTEGAAASGMLMATMSALGPSNNTVVVNKPFLAQVIHIDKVLFHGRVTDPSVLKID